MYVNGVEIFPTKMKKSLNNQKIQTKAPIFGQFFHVFSGLGEYYRIKPKSLALLEFSASFDTHSTPLALQLVEL